MWSPLNVLVSLDTAKRHARIPLDGAEQDTHLELVLYAAHESVITYVSQRLGDAGETWLETVAAWTEDTAPARVRLAICAQFLFLFRFRGDDAQGVGGDNEPTQEPGTLCAAAERQLYALRDPALA